MNTNMPSTLFSLPSVQSFSWCVRSDFRASEIPMQINFPALFIQINEKIIEK